MLRFDFGSLQVLFFRRVGGCGLGLMDLGFFSEAKSIVTDLSGGTSPVYTMKVPAIDGWAVVRESRLKAHELIVWWRLKWNSFSF
jgi:hypothetical protein